MQQDALFNYNQLSHIHSQYPFRPTLNAQTSKTSDSGARSSKSRIEFIGMQPDATNKRLDKPVVYHRWEFRLYPSWYPSRTCVLRFLSILVIAFCGCFKQPGQTEDSGLLVCSRKAFDLHPLDLEDLAHAAYIRFNELDQIEDLEEAITYYRQALSLHPPGHADRPSSLINLANAVYTRFNQRGDIEDLEEAVTGNRQALSLCPPGHPNRSASFNNLANTLLTRFNHLGQIEDLDEMIIFHRQILALRLPGDQNHSMSLNFLANAVYTRFNLRGDIEDLDEAIAYNRQALALCPPGHPDHYMSLNNLAIAVRTRFDQWGRIEDLGEAITCQRGELALCPPGHPDHSASLNDLAVTLSIRFDQQGNFEDLDEAITLNREAVALRPPGHPDRSSSLNNLANNVSTRFGQQGLTEDLDEAITCNREALALRPPGHPNRPSSLNNLANILSTRFQQWGRTEDLEEATTFHRQALALCPPDDLEISRFLTNLASSVSTCFDQWGQSEDLEEAITCSRQALALRPFGHPERSSSLTNLAKVLSTRFNHRGQVEDLEEAITNNREALSLCPAGHPDHSTALSNLASCLSTRFDQLGQIEDLEEVIICNCQALAFHPPGHLYRPVSLNNLANALATRFDQRGQLEDLEEAITCHCQALALCPPGHAERFSSLSSLGNALFTLFKQKGQLGGLEGTVACYREALALRPPGHPDRSASLGNLANAVAFRFSQQGLTEDLEEAITCNREALALCPPGHAARPISLGNLADSVFSRFHQLGGMEDLEEVIEHLSETQDILPTLHPLHAKFWRSLALTYLLRHRSHPQPDDCHHQAFRLFEDAADHPTATLKVRFDAAQHWAQEARHHHHESTVRAYASSLTLLDRYLNATPDIESQRRILAATPSIPKSLASDAASSAIEAGQLETAVESSEQGRSILWSKLRGYRHPLEQLRDINRRLADDFETLSGQLEHHAMTAGSGLTPPGPDEAGSRVSATFEAKLHHHRLLLEKWDNALRRIRQIEGFTDFLQNVPFATLRLAAAEGPVIIVNISEYRSDAIILHGMSHPVLVSLPDALPEDLALLSAQLTKRSMSIRGILRRLWDIVVRPVRDMLAILGVAERSRIWWCPTSELCGLPLHAAGPYEHKSRNLPDIYISSYTPTLSTLIKARSGIINRPALPNLLVMGQPGENLEVGMLPNVMEEIRRIHSFGDFVRVLVAGDVNRQNVLPHLRQHEWIHFACHGHQAAQPFQSSFGLHDDEQLTLIDLIRARLPNAEFAFLSACHSAAGDTGDTPDEVINLAAAVQFCGFRSVVGTLWAMADIDGPDVAEGFYRYMFRDLGAVDSGIRPRH